MELVLDGIRAIFARRCEAWRQRDIARQRGEKESAAQRHEREDAAISVKTATTRAREVGSDHPRVRRNTIAKSEAMAVRFQNICMA
jgi:hypothetical protein